MNDLKERLARACEHYYLDSVKAIQEYESLSLYGWAEIKREACTQFIMMIYREKIIDSDTCKAYIKDINPEFYEKILFQEKIVRDIKEKKKGNIL